MITMTSQEIKRLFIHRKDVFATQQTNGAYYPTRRPITIIDIDRHLEGKVTIGSYCLSLASTIKWGCIDIDGKPHELRRLRRKAEIIYEMFKDFPRILEFSGRKGFHIWVFFSPPVKAEYGQQLIKARLNRAGLNQHEIFPKQTELNENRKYGNLVKIPFALHKISGKKSVILKMKLKGLYGIKDI